MAREVGIELDLIDEDEGQINWYITTEGMKAFEALARADERNKLAAWMMAQGYATGHGDTTEDLLKELEWQVRESERELCAKACEELDKADDTFYRELSDASVCAATIRARGQA
jgi:hypothetical protein